MGKELCDRHGAEVLFGVWTGHWLRALEQSAVVLQSSLFFSDELKLDLIDLALHLGVGLANVSLELSREEVLGGGDLLANDWLALLSQHLLVP